jgi:hypothetical protein
MRLSTRYATQRHFFCRWSSSRDFVSGREQRADRWDLPVFLKPFEPADLPGEAPGSIRIGDVWGVQSEAANARYGAPRVKLASVHWDGASGVTRWYRHSQDGRRTKV